MDAVSEMSCMKCRVDDFKNSLCEGDFCKMYHGEGNGIDFINAVKASACPTVPVDDLISRQAVLNATSTTLKITGKENAETVYEYIKKLCDDIKSLPSAQQWIPCSERLPEDDGTYIVSGKWGSGKVSVGECEYYKHDGYFRTAWNFDVIAWMPLPEPYKGEKA